MLGLCSPRKSDAINKKAANHNLGLIRVFREIRG